MWPRMLELTLALWLAASPFVFRHGAGERVFFIADLACASAIALFALLSFGSRTRRAHLVNLLIAAGLIGIGYFGAETPPSAPAQNALIVGLLLAMFAILPSESSQPSAGWRRFYAEAGKVDLEAGRRG